MMPTVAFKGTWSSPCSSTLIHLCLLCHDKLERNTWLVINFIQTFPYRWYLRLCSVEAVPLRTAVCRRFAGQCFLEIPLQQGVWGKRSSQKQYGKTRGLGPVMSSRAGMGMALQSYSKLGRLSSWASQLFSTCLPWACEKKVWIAVCDSYGQQLG